MLQEWRRVAGQELTPWSDGLWRFGPVWPMGRAVSAFNGNDACALAATDQSAAGPAHSMELSVAEASVYAEASV